MGPDLEGVKADYPARLFAALRIALGAYLLVHCAHLVPWAEELFGPAGALPDPSVNFTHGLLPNPLARWNAPGLATAWLLGLSALSLLLLLGCARRSAAVGLWYGLACLFDRNNLISNPSLPYVGALLLLSATVPRGEPWALGAWKGDPGWRLPLWTWRAVWILLAVGYAVSGWDKLLTAPSWCDGSALGHVLELPLARPGPLRDALLGLPEPVLRLATWSMAGLECAFLPLALAARTRPVAWAAMTAAHVGILCSVAFADLTAGMLLVHAFAFDPAWIPGKTEGSTRSACTELSSVPSSAPAVRSAPRSARVPAGSATT